MTTTTEPISILNCEMGFAVPGGDSIIDYIRPDTGRSWHYGEDLEQIRGRYPGAVIVNINEHCMAKAARQDSPIRERYWEMLEVLPPAAMGGGGFLVGEPCDHHAITGQPRYDGFREWHGKFYEGSRPMTRKEYAAEMLNKPGNFKH